MAGYIFGGCSNALAGRCAVPKGLGATYAPATAAPVPAPTATPTSRALTPEPTAPPPPPQGPTAEGAGRVVEVRLVSGQSQPARRLHPMVVVWAGVWPHRTDSFVALSTQQLITQFGQRPLWVASISQQARPSVARPYQFTPVAMTFMLVVSQTGPDVFTILTEIVMACGCPMGGVVSLLAMDINLRSLHRTR